VVRYAVTTIAHRNGEDWNELHVEFGRGGEPVAYHQCVFDPDYPPDGRCWYRNISAERYARLLAIAQIRMQNKDVTTRVSDVVPEYREEIHD